METSSGKEVYNMENLWGVLSKKSSFFMVFQNKKYTTILKIFKFKVNLSSKFLKTNTGPNLTNI